MNNINKMNEETKQWLDSKLTNYEKNPVQTLFDLLDNLKGAAEQMLDNQGSKAALSVLNSANEHVELFLEAIEENQFINHILSIEDKTITDSETIRRIGEYNLNVLIENNENEAVINVIKTLVDMLKNL